MFFNIGFHSLKTCLLVFSIVSLLSLVAINRFNLIAYGESAGAYFFITPSMYIAKEIGELFHVAINISSVENLHSLGFTVTYNTSLLDVAQVVQGPFFPVSPRSYFEFEKNEPLGFIRVNMSLVDSETPRNGNGTLAWISFKVVQDPESCVSSPLDLKQTLLLNSALTPIVHDSVGAVYFWKSMQPDPPLEGRLLDLCTQKDGEGPDEPGGEFMVGEEVHLISRVTYNNDPVQQKLVAFEVRNPLNESVIIRTAITDKDGFAKISFRIPDIPSSVGVWTAISVVNIAEEITWDTISFRVYLRPRPVPVGGYSFPIKGYTTATHLTPYLALVGILTAVFITIKRKTHKQLGRRKRNMIFTFMLLLLLLRLNVLFGISERADITITDFYSCDSLGNPLDYFPKKTTAYFNVSVRNLVHDPKNISIYLTVQDESNVPIGSDQLYTTIPPDVSAHYIMSIFIPKWAYVGFATAYASLWEKGNPIDGKTIQFYIGPEDLTPPVIHILSPENATYVTRPFPLVFTIDERTTWIGYSLNGLENVTIGGNTTLAGLNIGSYRIMVYANDTSGNVGSSKEICFTVLNRPPIASFTESATTVPTGTIITFNASASYDPDGTIVNYFWDFGDGTNASDVIVTHSYVDNGTYTVTLTITDDDGATASTNATKTILNRPPVAIFSETAEIVYTDETINFNASASYDSDGVIFSYFWDFGDGTNATGILVNHAYAGNGTYTLTLTVTDDDSTSTSTKAIKTVLNRPDIAVTNVTTSKTVVGQGYNVSISVTVENQGDYTETFNVTCYANTTTIKTQEITLTSGSSTTITFTWNTTGTAKGNSTIKAYAWPVPSETDTADNTFTDGWVIVTMVGDITGLTLGVPDGIVDIFDLVALATHYGHLPPDGHSPGTLNYTMCFNADINGDNIIGIFDLVTVAKHYGEHW